MKQARKWSDDELRAAVASSTTYRGVLRALGLRKGSLGYIKGAIARLELNTSHFVNYEAKTLCSDDRLRELARDCKGTSEILDKLGVRRHSNAFYKLKRQARSLGIELAEIRERGRKWTPDQLRDAVRESRSHSEVIRRLGLIPAGGNFEHVKRSIEQLGLDTSHFTGRGWNTGLKFVPRPAPPLAEVLVAGRWTTSYGLKKRLFKAGLKEEKCERCGWCERAPDGRIPVELDHINGVKNDNRLENLRILCPNCHALQPTHRGLNQRRAIEKRRSN